MEFINIKGGSRYRTVCALCRCGMCGISLLCAGVSIWYCSSHTSCHSIHYCNPVSDSVKTFLWPPYLVLHSDSVRAVADPIHNMSPYQYRSCIPIYWWNPHPGMSNHRYPSPNQWGKIYRFNPIYKRRSSFTGLSLGKFRHGSRADRGKLHRAGVILPSTRFPLGGIIPLWQSNPPERQNHYRELYPKRASLLWKYFI